MKRFVVQTSGKACSVSENAMNFKAVRYQKQNKQT